MKLKDIIERTIILLGLEGEVEVTTPSNLLTKLTQCANSIYEELVMQYIDLKNNEDLIFEDGRCYYSSFKYRIKEILAVETNNEKIKFKVYPNFLYCGKDGTFNVKYLYYLSDLDLEDELVLPTNLTLNILSYGVISEYYYRQGLLDEAVFYKNRYDIAIDNLTKKLRSSYLPKRTIYR